MAATPKGPQKIKLDYYVDRESYNVFTRMCSSKGFAAHVVLERLMKKYGETGQL